MSIESAQQASSNQNVTPRQAASSKATTPVPQQQAAMSAMVQMNDVLLGDEMSMMGCDVESWNTARPHFHMQPHTPQAAPAQPTAFFACPPANLTRHMSLPVSMMRHDAVSHPVLHYAAPPSTPVHAVAMPPALVRHHSHGYVMTPQPQHVQFHVSRPVHEMQMQQMFELSIAHQQHHAQLSPHAMALKHEPAFAPTLSVEPMPFMPSSDNKQASTQQSSRLSMDDNFDIEPLPYAVFGSSERPKNIQQLESAIESLDRLLPDIEHDLFQQQQQAQQTHAAFVAMEQQQHAMTMNANLITPRPVVYGRSALPLLLSPQGKDLATSPATMTAMALSGMLVSNQSYSSSSYTPKSARNMATCSVDGCDRRVRSKGFCKTHGGGRKCNIEGCKKSSQNGEFCIGHGGGKKCKEDGCAKAAQSHGLCKAHGGGARCKFLDCNKSSQGGGLCRAHGGGKRCQASGCPKGAQRGNFCATHGGFRNCKIDGCVRTDRGGGFCEVHRRGRLCKIDGCKKLSRNQGMCTMHIREEKQDESAESEESAAPSGMVLEA